MILYRWRGISSNFGDELNTVLWPRLLPGFFDEEAGVQFLGIGSVLDRRHASQAIKIVAGSGYGGYERKPILDRTWIIHWVRGPRTAAMLGLPERQALGDPAILVSTALGLPPVHGNDIGFMPHFESAARGAWQLVADRAGVRLIDPRDPPEAILRAIGNCKILISEALHGVIVADALRVPWIPIRPIATIHRAKWSDWADTLALQPSFRVLPPSTLSEWANASRLGAWHATRAWLDRQQTRLQTMTSERQIQRAAEALRVATYATPQLSADKAIDRCQSRMLDALHALRLQPMSAITHDDSPYQPRRIPDTNHKSAPAMASAHASTVMPESVGSHALPTPQ